ncbi:hypothetical protein [Streptomyces sp. P9-A2]|uniref:hypothetical protein n=1 Tax=Streptomyces sp. P9-A2 TaxID=3072284 RepID=UPI002FCB8B34
MRSQILNALMGFLPGWVQITVLALIVLAFVGSCAVKIKRRAAYRRATDAGRPVHAAAQYGQGSGADYLGQYAPRPSQAGPPARTTRPCAGHGGGERCRLPRGLRTRAAAPG